MKVEIDLTAIDHKDYLESLREHGDLDVFLELLDDDEITTEAERRDYRVYHRDVDILEDFCDQELREELSERAGRDVVNDEFVFDACTDLRTALRDGKRDEALRIAEEIYRDVLGVAV